MDSEKPHSLGSLATRMACTFVGLLLLYVLSYGPAFYVFERYPQSRPMIDTAYKQLGIVMRRSPLDQPYQAYLEWWIHLADRSIKRCPINQPPS